MEGSIKSASSTSWVARGALTRSCGVRATSPDGGLDSLLLALFPIDPAPPRTSEVSQENERPQRAARVRGDVGEIRALAVIDGGPIDSTFRGWGTGCFLEVGRGRVVSVESM